MLAVIRRASSRVSSFAAARRPGVGERLPVGVADDESTADPSFWVGLFDGLSKVLTGCGVRWRFTQSA